MFSNQYANILQINFRFVQEHFSRTTRIKFVQLICKHPHIMYDHFCSKYVPWDWVRATRFKLFESLCIIKLTQVSIVDSCKSVLSEFTLILYSFPYTSYQFCGYSCCTYQFSFVIFFNNVYNLWWFFLSFDSTCNLYTCTGYSFEFTHGYFYVF